METTLVYRIETIQGTGMYAFISGIDGLYCNERCPAPENDKVLMKAFRYKRPGAGWVYGFQNTKMLRQWVRHVAWRRLLVKKGLTIWVYEVPCGQVVHGERQTVFQRKGAKRIRQIALTEVHKVTE